MDAVSKPSSSDSESSRDYFDALYARSDDPWHLREGWYEHRKRQLTLAALPRERYRNAFELGCANGELTALLAVRCDALLAADLHDTAVRVARERLNVECEQRVDRVGLRQQDRPDNRHVRIERLTMPAEWPNDDGPFDLIVISELAYYLALADLEGLARCIAQNLSSDGTLLACHWKRPFDAAHHTAADIHHCFDAHCGLTRVVHHDEPDFLLDVWTRDGRSVAEREGRA